MDNVDRSYVVVSIRVNDDDTPTRTPEEVAKDIADARIEGIAEARPAYHDGFGSLVQYGTSEVAL